MEWSSISFRPDARTLRQFAVAWLVFFGALAAWYGLMRDKKIYAIVLVIMTVVVGGAGLLRPGLVRWLYVAALVLTFPIGWVVSRLLLAVLYFGIITPLAWFFRLRGRDVLGLRRRDAASYWEPWPPVGEVRSYFRQF